jgi:hypothetical protein
MKHILFFICAFSLFLLGCSSAKKAKKSLITEGLAGQITEVSGNRMPMADAPRSVPKGILTTLYVYELTNKGQVQSEGNSPIYTAIATKQVASVLTDSSGNYQISLAPGTYSLFIKMGEKYYSNLYDEKNNIAPVTVEPGKITRANLQVSLNARF